MTLSAFTISEMAANWHKLLPVRLFAIIVLYIYISQGSVTTRLRCGEVFNNRFIANGRQNASLKKFRKTVNIWQRYGQYVHLYQ